MSISNECFLTRPEKLILHLCSLFKMMLRWYEIFKIILRIFWIYCLQKHIVIYFAIHGECNNLNGCNVIAYDVGIGRKEIEYVMMIQFFFISLSQKNWSMLPLAFVTSSTYFTTLSFFLSFMCGKKPLCHVITLMHALINVP